MDKKQEELLQLQMLEQEAAQYGEQLKVIEEQKNEMKMLKENLKNLSEHGEAESYAEFGKGIYVKTKLQKGDLLVDVGRKVMVPKSPEEVRKIIDEQVNKFEEVKGEIGKRINQINAKVDFIIKSASGSESNKEDVKKNVGKKK